MLDEREMILLFFALRRVLPCACLRMLEPSAPSEGQRREMDNLRIMERLKMLRTRCVEGKTRDEGIVAEDSYDDRQQGAECACSK